MRLVKRCDALGAGLMTVVKDAINFSPQVPGSSGNLAFVKHGPNAGLPFGYWPHSVHLYACGNALYLQQVKHETTLYE